jgi:hypothetical protein
MFRVLLVRLMPIMGKAEKVSRCTANSAVVGSVPRIWARRPSTYNSACTISVDQSKKTSTAADPRPVVERMLAVPGMFFMASSTGRVIVAIISSAGMTPLSIRITTRGKSVRGKTEAGIT